MATLFTLQIDFDIFLKYLAFVIVFHIEEDW